MTTVHRERFRVAMPDTDAFGIVYFAAYWRWYQQALEGLLERSGRSMRAVLGEIGLPAVHAEIDYRRQLHLSDDVNVEIAVVRVGNRSVGVRARFLGPDGEETARAETVHVVARPESGAVRAPDWLRALACDHPWP